MTQLVYQKTAPTSEGSLRIPVRTIRESGAVGADESLRSPYVQIPAIELVRREFCASPVGTLIEDAVRSIAARIGRSSSAITPALKRLQNDGWISYIADGRGMLIEVLRSDQQTDRSVSLAAPPIVADTAPVSDEPAPPIDREVDRSFTALESDRGVDRSACMDDPDSKIQEEESRPPSFSFETDPLYQRLTANPRMNRTLARTIATSPPGTVADFESDLRLAGTFARSSFFFTVARWSDHQRVLAPEVCDERPERSGRSARPGIDTAKRQLDPTGAAYPERGPVRTRLTY